MLGLILRSEGECCFTEVCGIVEHPKGLILDTLDPQNILRVRIIGKNKTGLFIDLDLKFYEPEVT